MTAVYVHEIREENVPLSKRTRFEVFKRDSFTCQYCRRGTPEVVLEVDHVIPRAEGGPDEMENLVTACYDCNRGKAHIPLTDHAPVPDLPAQTAMIQEREEQVRAYHAMRNERAQRREDDFVDVWNYWFEAWGYRGKEMYKWHLPWETTLRRYTELLGVGEVKEAMDIAAGKFRRQVTSNAVRYFVGILKRKADERG